MKKLLTLLFLLIASPAWATYFHVSDCATIPGPEEADVCAQLTTASGRTSGHLYIYRSAAWVDVDTLGGVGAPADATFIVQTPSTDLSAEQALSTLATGILKNTTGTGVLSIASPGTDYVAPTGSGAGLTALNASALASGTVGTARLGSGTANGTTFLAGNGTWATPPGGAFPSNPANCSAGNAPLGVDANGAAENCFDVATQVELNTHAGLTGTNAHGATTTNTASQLVSRDASGNFAANIVTATLTGNVTGNVTGNADTATTATALTSMLHSQFDGLDADDHSAINVKYESTAGAPAAGSCDRDGQIQFDTTNSKIYSCFGSGGNPVDIGTQSDAYYQVTDGTYTSTAVGGEALTFAGSDSIEAHVFSYTDTFTNQPAGDGIEVVSSDVLNTSTILIFGKRTGKRTGSLSSETITLNGTTPVSSVYTDWQTIVAAVYATSPVGTITIREASGDQTITTLTGTVRVANQDIVIFDSRPQYSMKVVEMVPFAPTTDVATGDGKAYYRVPTTMDGMNLTAVSGNVMTAGTTGTTDVQIAKCTAAATGNVCSGTVADILSTKLTIDTGENSSSTAASAAVINATNRRVVSGDVLRVDVDAVSTTAPKGLIVALEFSLP